MGEHATLSPSGSETWISCPASIRMTRDMESDSSIYAEEGTAAHELGFLLASRDLLGMTTRKFNFRLKAWREKYGQFETDEMWEYCGDYVEVLRTKVAEHEGSILLLEQKVPTGIPSCWGTSDAVIVSPVHVEIVDLKYGMGVKVFAPKNSQLRLYGVGSLEAFGDLLGEVETVRCTVYQPRLQHVSTESLTALELRSWRDSIIPIAESALGEDAKFGPSGETCRWCPAKGQCVAQMKYATELDFGVKADVLEGNELADALDRIPAIEAWCAAVRNHALDLVYSKNGKIPGYKVVRSGGRRAVTDPEAAQEALLLVGYTLDQVVNPGKLKGIGDLESLLKKDFDTVMGPFVRKGDGSPSLVKESDSRPDINPEVDAAKDFTPITDTPHTEE